MPRGCSKYGKMPPPIVYDIVHILLPKKFTVASISAHPDFQKNAHRDLFLQVIYKLTGQGAFNRIPSLLRKQPKLFFKGFEQLKARAAKVLKDDPDLGRTAIGGADGGAAGGAAAADVGAAVAKTGGDAVVAQAGAAVATDLIAKAVVPRTS